MTEKIRRRKQVFTIIISILVTALYIRILLFSLTPAVVSTQQSITVSEYIVNFIERTLSISLNLSEVQFSRFENFIRKAAHFSEYAMLGFLLYSIPMVWEKRNFKPAFYIFLAIVILASVDETVQLFVPGRAGRVTDVLIDGAGGIFGILFLRMFFGIYASIKQKVKK